MRKTPSFPFPTHLEYNFTPEAEINHGLPSGESKTSFHINGQYVHRVHLRIRKADGQIADASFKARGARLRYLQGLREENKKLPLLFLPENPDRLALLGVAEDHSSLSG